MPRVARLAELEKYIRTIAEFTEETASLTAVGNQARAWSISAASFFTRLELLGVARGIVSSEAGDLDFLLDAAGIQETGERGYDELAKLVQKAKRGQVSSVSSPRFFYRTSNNDVQELPVSGDSDVNIKKLKPEMEALVRILIYRALSVVEKFYHPKDEVNEGRDFEQCFGLESHLRPISADDLTSSPRRDITLPDINTFLYYRGSHRKLESSIFQYLWNTRRINIYQLTNDESSKLGVTQAEGACAPSFNCSF